MVALHEIRKAQQSYEQHQRDEQKLRLRIAAVARNALVKISGIAYADSTIQIGTSQYTLDVDRTNAAFSLSQMGSDIEIVDLSA